MYYQKKIAISVNWLIPFLCIISMLVYGVLLLRKSLISIEDNSNLLLSRGVADSYPRVFHRGIFEVWDELEFHDVGNKCVYVFSLVHRTLCVFIHYNTGEDSSEEDHACIHCTLWGDVH